MGEYYSLVGNLDGLGGSVDSKAYEIIMKGWERKPVTRDECVYLFGFGPNSLEADLGRMAANQLVRSSSKNSAVISSQIGIMLGPCQADCGFCNFRASQNKMRPFIMSDEEFLLRVRDITQYNDIRTMNLMTMHKFDLDELLHKIKLFRKEVPNKFNISVNAGDMDYDTCVELKKAGADRAYHVCRLREGIDTRLRPEARIQTMRNMMDAGLPVSTCTEPVGPEHTAEEIVDNFFLGLDTGCDTFAVMRRVAVPGTPLAKYGQISEARMTQMSSVFVLALASNAKVPAVNVHEPCQSGFYSGAYLLSAEYGGNPRDRSAETEKNRGMSVGDCRVALFDAGFDHLIDSEGQRVKLDMDYLVRTNSF